MVYEWKESVRGPISAQVFGERIEFIRQRRGTVTALAVVEDARANDSPLHRCFEWNDATAAELHRATRARDLMRLVVVVIEEAPEIKTRAFVAIHKQSDDEVAAASGHNKPLARSYEAIDVVMADKELRRKLLKQALNELHALAWKYANLVELEKIRQTIDAAYLDLEIEEMAAVT